MNTKISWVGYWSFHTSMWMVLNRLNLSRHLDKITFTELPGSSGGTVMNFEYWKLDQVPLLTPSSIFAHYYCFLKNKYCQKNLTP